MLATAMASGVCRLCDSKHPGGPESCEELRTGEVVNKLEVGDLLGLGGMAAVYKATHRVLQREVALKVLHKRFATDHELAARFVREARATAAVGHPAFVGVHDAGVTDDGCAYIEMDRLDGRDLYSVRKEEGRIAPDRAARIAIAILSALEALHARGVIHRDLKSANIFLVPQPDGTEQVKLIDLGFAKVADEQKLTTPEQLLGTPFYISPEQYIDPTTVDHRADLFSLGVVLYEVLVGDWPYEFKSKNSLMTKVVNGDLERHPGRREIDVPPWLDAVVAKALAHDREQRWVDAAAMRAPLEAGLATRPSFLRRVFRRPTQP